MTTFLQFSAIIPVKNQAEQLSRLLDSLDRNASADYLTEIIVVDDASDIDIRAVAVRYERVRYVALERSSGPAAARNVGAEIARNENLFFLDADVICPSGLFEKAASVLDSHPDHGAVSFLNQAYDAEAGTIANFYAVIEDYWFSSILGEGNDIAEARGFMTRGGAIRKEAFWAVKGFDARYKTNAHEDYDFGKRLCAQYRVLVTDTPRMYHSYPTSLPRLLRNYWVRTLLFIPYYLTHRPRLDKMQSSSGEAIMRILGVASGAVGVCTVFLPLPFRMLGLIFAIAGLAGYAWSISALLKRAWRMSGRIGFATTFMGVHYLSSIVIILAVGVALVFWPLSSSSMKLLSPIESSKPNNNQH